MSFRKILAILLVVQLVTVALHAQAPAAAQSQPASPAAAPTVDDLKILVLEGQKSINNTSKHIGVQPVVEIRDQNDRPVEGATVVFRLPPSGPGGSFPGNSSTFSTRSNAQGQAGASGFVPNDQLGRFDIHVTATLQNRIGQVTISETNSQSNLSVVTSPPKPKRFYRNKYFIAGVGAAIVATVVVVLVTRHSSSSAAPNTTVTITPGPVTINQ